MPWDSTMRIPRKGEKEKTDKEMAHIVYSRFANGDTKTGIMFSLGGLYVRRYVIMASKSAVAAIRETDGVRFDAKLGIECSGLLPSKSKVCREHIIPVSALYAHLDEKYKQGKLTEAYILKWMPMLHLAIITEKENQKLKAAHLNSKMPDGWWSVLDRNGPKKANPLERYRKAGLSDSIWYSFKDKCLLLR